MNKSILLYLFLFNFLHATFSQNDFKTVFEKSNGTETATYPEVVSFYKKLATQSEFVDLQEMGKTDSGELLHIAMYNSDKTFDFKDIRKDKTILLINNGIHPGESDGIDATQLLFKDLVQRNIKIPANTVVITIPIYNIGGALNRNTTTRTNQNGPKAYGFRGNARNYDLNRDFIKNDTRNALAFAEIFHKVQPDIFIDNHVSNGADYQYTLTHLFTQHNALGGALGKYLHTEVRPSLERKLKVKNWDITPYVNVWGTTPDKGWAQFMDYPRYSTGYTSLWNTLGMMVETHMLKPYKQRVEGTYELLKIMIEIAEEKGSEIRSLRKEAFEFYQKQKVYLTNWKVDSTKNRIITFKGYEGKTIPSAITTLPRLQYDQSLPYTKEVAYQDTFKPTLSINVPKAYVIPQGWWSVLERLKINEVEYQLLKKDTVIEVESYRISDYKTRKEAYEGHYLHEDTKVSRKTLKKAFNKGDIIVYTDQNSIRYLLETLEPEAIDSFFNWNFFDTILQQKENFSPYVWEDKAAELLKKDLDLKDRFLNMKKDTIFNSNSNYQLDWIHKNSDYYEKAHLQYPIYRIIK
ncbi:M14 family metallopeptidase [Aquimarina sp. ERC-38]|uniref:M14 family metallopeptidase n=1 Tax=Aquimarina sp. ERC-38 TaxID=2949996 RepID=UPI0022455F57|nr:M14 family metallopeptidase [Aquimarina sp. ERC-38]UZO80553.1 M14 family metallopeptidase [Aquimarina sp. ERC-38]